MRNKGGKEMKTREEIKQWILDNCIDEGGDVDLRKLDFSDFDGDVWLSQMKVKKSLYQDHQEVGEELYQDEQKVNGDLYQNRQKVGGGLIQAYQKVDGNLRQDHQKIKGDLCQCGQEVGGILCQDGHTKSDTEFRVVFYDGDGHEEWTSYYDSIEVGIEDEIDEEIINATSKPDYYIIQEREVGKWTDVEKCGVE